MTHANGDAVEAEGDYKSVDVLVTAVETTNLAIVFNVFKKRVARFGLKAAKLLEPMHEKAHEQRDKISFRANAKFYQNPEKLIDNACKLASLAPNIQIKAPASKAGIEVFEEITYRGVSIQFY